MVARGVGRTRSVAVTPTGPFTTITPLGKVGLITCVHDTLRTARRTTAGGRDLVDILAAEHPSVHTLLVDNGYRSSVAERAEQFGIDLVVSQKPDGAKGFVSTRSWRRPPMQVCATKAGLYVVCLRKRSW